MGSDDFYPEERPVHRISVDGFSVLFDPRRRGFADFLGETVVLYDDATTASMRPSDQNGDSVAPDQDRSSG